MNDDERLFSVVELNRYIGRRLHDSIHETNPCELSRRSQFSGRLESIEPNWIILHNFDNNAIFHQRYLSPSIDMFNMYNF